MPLVPSADTPRAELLAMVRETPRWEPAIRAIAARHHLGPGAPVRASHGWTPTFFWGEHVIKMIPPPWRVQWERERIVLPRVRGKLGVPTPRLLAADEIEGWPYLVLSRLVGER